jgi:hypothetical protein
VLFSNLRYRFCGEEWPAGAPQRAVRHDVDALLLAEVDNLLLGQRRVVLNLVHRGDDCGVGEKLLKIALAVVANTDGFSFAGGEESLHLLPRVDVGVGVDDVALAVGELGELVVVSW